MIIRLYDLNIEYDAKFRSTVNGRKHMVLSAIGGRKSTKTILVHVNFTFSWIHGCKTRESKMQILTIGRSICSFSFRIIRSMSYYDR